MAARQFIYHMQGLSKTWPGGKKVLENIHLSFYPDAKIGVLGVNGSGKSTLLRIMAGIDTEFVGEDSYHPSLCLVQVAAGDRLFIIDPLSVGPLDAFWQLVIDPSRVAVVHAGREEVRLCRLGGGAPPGNLFDLQLAAGLAGFPYPLSHGALVNQVLGVQIPAGLLGAHFVFDSFDQAGDLSHASASWAIASGAGTRSLT